jgi:hypothetical protein
MLPFRLCNDRVSSDKERGGADRSFTKTSLNEPGTQEN